MKQTIIAAMLAAIAGSAFAGVGPNAIRIELAQKSKTIQFESTEKAPVRYEATISKWTQDGLEPTKDVIVYPPVFQVAPESKQALKIVARKPRGEVEGTYRLVFKSVEGGGVNISVPVFLPPAVKGQPDVTATRSGKLVTLKNAGNVTERITKVEKNKASSDVLIYVLPGQETQVEAEGAEQFIGDAATYSVK